MATNQKDVELIIRAKDQSTATLKDIAASVDKLSSALNDQIAAAAKGDVSLNELKETMKALENAGKALIQQQGVVDLYNKLGESATKAATATDTAKDKFAAMATALADVEAPTKRQEAALLALDKAWDRSVANAAKINDNLEKQGARLASAGIDTKSLATAQDGLVEAAQRTGVAISAASTVIDSYQANLRKLKAAEQEEADTKLFERKAQDAQNLVKAGEYVRFWTDALQTQEAAEAKVAQDQAMTKKIQQDLADFQAIGVQAQAAARGYNTLGDSSIRLAQAASLLGPVISGITDPATAARSTLGGLADQVDKLAVSVGSINAPFDHYTESLRELQTAQKAIAGQAGLVDNFNNQMAAVKAARAAFQDARTSALQYADAIKQSSAPNDELIVKSKQAESALAAASRQFNTQVASARAARAALEQAGISTTNFASSEQKLVETSRTAASAVDQLTASHQKFNVEGAKTASATNLLTGSTRESLSWYQRVRGELIALATAYVGLQGAIGLAKGSLAAYVDQQAVENRLGIVVGNDSQKIGAEWDYLHGQALRLGIGIKDLGDSYSKFALAAKSGNLTLDQTKYAFERITEVMRINHASGDAVTGAFYQLEQMLSKNKVQLDDLKQAANWIPGLEALMAKGLGMVNAQQLFAQMKKGAVDAKVAILSLAAEMEKQYADQLPTALKSLQAEQGRFNTRFTDFQRLIATSGFADAYTVLLKKLSDFFASTDGETFAKNISSAFSSVVTVLGFVVDHLKLVEYGIGAAIGLSALTMIGRTALAIDKLVAGVVALSAAYKAAGTASLLMGTKTAVATTGGVVATEGAAVAPVILTGWQRLGQLMGVAFNWVKSIAASLITATVSAAAFVAALPVEGVVAGLAAVAVAVGLIWYKFDDLKTLAATVWHDLPYNADIAWKSLQLGLSNFGDSWVTVWTSISSFFSSVWTGIATFVKDKWDYIVSLFDGFVELIQSKMGAAGAPIKALWEDIKSGAKGMYDSVAGWFDKVATKAKSIATTIKDAYVSYLNVITSPFQDGQSERSQSLRQQIKDTQNQRDGLAPASSAAAPASNQVQQHKDALDQIEASEKVINDLVAKRGKMEDDIRAARQSGAMSQATAEAKMKQTVADFKGPIEAASKQTAELAMSLSSVLTPDEYHSAVAKSIGSNANYEKPNIDNTEKNKNASKIATLQQSLKTQLEQLEASVDRSDGTREGKIKAITEQYQKLYDKVVQLQKLGGTSIDGKSLDSYKQQLATMIELKGQEAGLAYDRDQQAKAVAEMQKAEVAVNDAVKERADIFKDINAQVAAGQLTAQQGYQKIQDANAKLTPEIQKLAAAANDTANKLRGTQPGIDAKVDALIAKNAKITNGTGEDGLTGGPTGATGKAGAALLAVDEQRLNAVIAERNDLVSTYQKLVELGLMTTTDAQEKTKQAYADANVQISKQVDDITAAAGEMRAAGDIDSTKFDALIGKMKLVQANSVYMSADMVKLKNTVEQGFTSGASKAFESVAEGIAGAIKGTESWGQAFANVGKAAATFISGLLLQIGQAIVQIVAMKAALATISMFGGASSSGAAFGLADSAAPAAGFISAGFGAVLHSGGIVGQSDNVSRPVAQEWFANAPKYHTGGVVGLQPSEQAAILQKGEEVLTRNDPRNAMNAMLNPKPMSGGTSISQILSFDPDEIHNLTASQRGQEVLVSNIKANRSTIKKLLNP